MNVIEYCKKNKDLEIQDLFKFLYQSCLGCEHLVSSKEKALNYLKQELEVSQLDDLDDIEELDGDFVRIHLKMINDKFNIEKLCDLFIESSARVEVGLERLEKELDNLIEYSKDGLIPFNNEEVIDRVNEWKKLGLPPIHHSDKFRASHHPAYRVIKKTLVDKLLK